MRIVFAAAAALTATGAILFGGALRPATSSPTPPVRQAVVAESAASGFARYDTQSLIAQVRGVLETRPGDARALTTLGLAYHQRSRETGAPEWYTRAEKALQAALAREPGNAEALLGLAGVAASRHRFAEALDYARRSHHARPAWAAPFGIIGDANLELGRYKAAFAAFDRQTALRPSTSAYARISYARELLGDLDGSREAMELAVDAAGTSGEAAAWARVQLANLYTARGRLGTAEGLYREALVFSPRYAAALSGLGQLREARGSLRAAAGLYRRALAAAPVPEYATLLGDVLARMGDNTGAARAWARAERLEGRFAAAGGRNELETAMFDLDHDRNVRDALRRARAGYAERPSVEGEHVMAWALYKNDRCAEARRHSVRHLRLGTPDLDGLYHRSLIERCLGNDAAAATFVKRIRSLDPYYLAAPPSARRFPLAS